MDGRPGIIWWWSPRDRYRFIAPVAGLGLALGATAAMLGLPPISIHGPLHQFGVMDPFCGATRSVRYAVRGQWALSWRYNPLGIPLVVGAVSAVARALMGAVSGRWLTVSMSRDRRRQLTWVVGALLTLLEVRQQLNAPLLLGR